MAKSGTPRHSKTARKPVTINLDPSEVKRMDESAAAKPVPPAEPVGDFSRDAGPKPSAKPEKPDSEKPPFVAGVKPEAEKPRAAATGASGPAVPPAPQKTGSGASSLLAGVAGGVIAFGGLLALQWGNVIPSPGARVTAQELARMEQEIADLRTNPAPAPLDDAARAQLAQLQKNVEAAEIKAEAVAGALTQVQQQIEALPKTAESGASPEAEARIEALTGRLDALESKLTAAQDQAQQAAAAASGSSGTISSLETKLASLEQAVSDTARQPDAAALIAANALKTAIDRGGSFKAELDTYASLAPQDASVERLQAFADKGVATVADLNAWFGPVANRIVATENSLPADAGIWDQLMASARGLVSVRPVAGNVSGEGVGPATARMEAALQAGDLERAIAEWEQLPAGAKAVSEDFANQMKARRDADALIQRLVADSLKPKTPEGNAGGTATPAGN